MGIKFCGFADEAGGSIEDQIEVTKALGWSAIEARLLDGVNFAKVSDEAFERALEKLEEAGITIPVFGSPLANWRRPVTADFEEDVEDLKRLIPRMHRCGAKMVRCMSYPNDGLPKDQWRDEVVRRLKALAAMAEDAGVILVHENCSGYGGEGPQEALDLLEAVDSDSFRFAFDTGNPVFHGEQDSLEFYEAVKDFVVHVHVKDAKPGPDGKPIPCYPDEGEGHVQEIVTDLVKRGYDGYLSIEPHMAAVIHEGKGASNKEEAKAIYIEYGKRLMRMVEQASKE